MMFTIEVADPGSPEADAMVKAYFADIASRWHGRPVTDDEVRQAMVGEPYDDLREPTGLFLVASTDGEAAACAGVRFGDGVAELTKVFTLPEHRGRGAGQRLLGAVEQACRDREIVTLRLATRAQLTEACAL